MTSKHYDAILIGAGSVGAPAAYSLAEAGVKTLVIDKAPSVGQGSNKTAIGGIRATHSDPAKIRLCLRSIEIFANWKELMATRSSGTGEGIPSSPTANKRKER